MFLGFDALNIKADKQLSINQVNLEGRLVKVEDIKLTNSLTVF